MKLLALAVLAVELLVVAVHVSGQPNHAADEKQKPTQEHSQTSVARDAPDHYGSADERQRTGDAKPPKWYASIKWAEWLLVVAAFLTLVVVGWQSRATARATKAMERSVNLQEANMRQWVDVEITGVQSIDALTDGAKLRENVVIQIKFKAINNTPHTFKIKKVTTKISRNRGPEEMGWETFEVEEEATLPPSKEGKESNYPFYVTLDLEGPAVKTYMDDKLLVSIAGYVFIEPAIGGSGPQAESFGYLTVCGFSGIKILPYIGKEPQKRNTKG